MDLGLKGKVALVLAASGGLGSAIARTLAQEGASVAVAGRNSASIEMVADAIRSEGGNSLPIVWDLNDLSCIDANVSRIEGELGPVDILVNNTGGPPPAATTGPKPEDWQQHFQSMVLSLIATTNRVLPAMRQRGFGRVITSTSSGVITPIPNLSISNALRSTLVGWSKTLATEVARDGVTVNMVVPGRIATDRTQFLDTKKAEQAGVPLETIEAQSAASIPVGRYGDPAEYADLVAFIASERASYITGSTIRVDGGLIASV